jgi:hypothetical protein
VEYNNKTEELLCEMYRNVKMGSDSLCDVTSKISDRFMLKNVTGQIGGYAELQSKCKALMDEHHVKPKKESALKRAMAKGGIALNTVFDSSDEHIAEMIVKGTEMGADSLEKTMNTCKKYGVSENIVDLCENVIKFERGASGAMKDYTVK